MIQSYYHCGSGLSRDVWGEYWSTDKKQPPHNRVCHMTNQYYEEVVI